ncbi:MAG: hypothetical protein ACRC8S_13115 [Fimbriiglobus sp.]
MTKTFRKLTFTLIALLGLSFVAQAQPPGAPAPRPSVSPYLNLVNRGNNPALNYLSIVRPQQQMAQQFNQLNQQYRQSINGLQNSIDQLGQEQNQSFNPFTGHAAVFNSTYGYFSRHPVSGTMAGGGGGGMGMGGGFGGGARSFGGGAMMGGGGAMMGGMGMGGGRGAMPGMGGGGMAPRGGGVGGIRR